MTAPNSQAIIRCIKQALKNTHISAKDIDVINGHLTATAKDPLEITNWTLGLERSGEDFPYINSFKGMIGHCIAAAGSIECVGAVLQIAKKTVYGNVNCEDLHPEIAQIISPDKIPLKSFEFQPNIVAKASFGFGDVNAIVIFKNYNN